jgi:hypothetical protein
MDAGAKSTNHLTKSNSNYSDHEIGNWKDMGAISIKQCSATEAAQQWNVMADGRIALVASSPRKPGLSVGNEQG